MTQVLGGVIFPGKPIANMITNVWIYGSVAQAVAFLQDFKLGHYMKIPPRTMFSVQVSTYVRMELYVCTYGWNWAAAHDPPHALVKSGLGMDKIG